MTTVYRCDGCARLLEGDEFRLEVAVQNEPTVEVDEDADDGDDEAVEVDVEMPEIPQVWWEAEHHFCSPACLGAWAMDRAIDAGGSAVFGG